MKLITFVSNPGQIRVPHPHWLQCSPWPSSKGKNAWHGRSIPGINSGEWCYMHSPLPGAVPHVCGVCIWTHSTLKRIPLSELEMVSIVKGTVQLKHGLLTNQSSWKFTLSQVTNLRGLLWFFFLWKNEIQYF